MANDLMRLAKEVFGTKFILIGDIGYARLSSPTAFDMEKRAEYAEHQVTEGKPLLQFMGPSLDRVDLSFTFHADFIDVQYAWDRLVDVLNSRSAFPVSMGNGLLVGWFVLTELRRTASVTEEDGSLTSADFRVMLKEWVDPLPLKTRASEKKETAGAVKKTGKRKPKSKMATVPKAAGSGDHTSVTAKTVVRQ